MEIRDDSDVGAIVDVAEERQKFLAREGKDPEAWLEEWEHGKIPHNGPTYATMYWAKLITGRGTRKDC